LVRQKVHTCQIPRLSCPTKQKQRQRGWRDKKLLLRVLTKGAYLPSTPEAPAEQPKQGAYLPDAGPGGLVAPTETPSTDTAVSDGLYKPSIFTATVTPKAAAARPSTQALGQALGTTTGLTAFRDAGEIESKQTGGKRRNVWNEESLRLKDALGV
jgi:hypothetical protein